MVAITKAIGRKAAMEMLLTGRFLPATEAKELGLINKVVPLEELAEKTLELARQITNASRLTLEFGKQGFYAQVDQADEKTLHYAKHTIALNNLAVDAQAGIKAFLNQTTPQWQNR